MIPFTHLHLHTHYSLLDGATRIPALMKHVKENGMDAVACTDHGNLYSMVEFLTTAQKFGVKPIIGMEAYIAPGSRMDRGWSRDAHQDYAYHLTLLARTGTGVRNLMRLSSEAFLTGYYYKPRIDREILAQHSEGLICLSGCASSELSDYLLSGNFPQARSLAEWYLQTFKSNFYFEIQDNGVPIQQDLLAPTIDLAFRLGAPVVATSDAHYLTSDDSRYHDILLCINTKKTIHDKNRMRFSTNQFHVRSPNEMVAAMPGHLQAVKQSALIAASVEEFYPSLGLGKRQFPSFPLPAGMTSEERLVELCWKAIQELGSNFEELQGGLDNSISPLMSSKHGDAFSHGEKGRKIALKMQPVRQPIPKDRSKEKRMSMDGCQSTSVLEDRLQHELAIIKRMGFSSYFLIVWDICKFMQKSRILYSARGSACGCLVAHLLRISRIDPIAHGLLFERFIDPARSEPPDIDLDIDKERRDEVIQYVRKRYGDDCVAHIGTFGTLKARGVIKDVGRAIGMDYPRVAEISGLIPERQYPPVTLKSAFDEEPALRAIRESTPQHRHLFACAFALEGTARSAGTHAAGIVIASEPLINLVPLQRLPVRDKHSTPVISTQWSMNDVERVGLLKLDLLGLRNLTVLGRTVALVNERYRTCEDIYKLSLDDQQTYSLLCAGDTRGIFQVEGSGIRELLVRIKPDRFSDLVAIIALYRPGPLGSGMVDDYVSGKHGLKQPHYDHPICEEILSSTYGLMVFQEQIMKVLHRLGGMELTRAYSCIKAISKKIPEKVKAFREEFIAGAMANVSQKLAEAIFSKIEYFSGYGFNLSHSTAYAYLLYQTAYLKAHYPVEFMASLLSCEMDGSEREKFLAEHINNCREMGIPILGPDINKSQYHFTVESCQLRSSPPCNDPITLMNVQTSACKHTSMDSSKVFRATLKDSKNLLTNRESFPISPADTMTAGLLPSGVMPTTKIDKTGLITSKGIDQASSAQLPLCQNKSFNHVQKILEKDIMKDGCSSTNSELKLLNLQPNVLAIRFGLGAIKGLGKSVVQSLIAARTSPFTSINQLLKKIPLEHSQLQKLIYAGCFDELNPNRAAWLETLKKEVASAKKNARDARRGQLSLFSGMDEPDLAQAHNPSRNEHDGNHAQWLRHEKNVLGFYLTGNPLDPYYATLAALAPVRIDQLETHPRSHKAILGCWITHIHTKNAKKSKGGPTRMARLTLADASGSITAMIWPTEYAKYHTLISTDKPLFIFGHVDRSSGTLQLIIDQITDFLMGVSLLVQGLIISNPASELQLSALRRVCLRHPGTVSLYFTVGSTQLKARQRIKYSPEVAAEIESIVGPGSVKFMPNVREKTDVK